MISSEVLSRVWPSKYFPPSDGLDPEVSKGAEASQITEIPSLAAISFRAALKLALESKSIEDVAALAAVPFNAEVVKEVLETLTQGSAIVDAIIPVLLKTLKAHPPKEPDALDLRQLQLSSEQVIAVAAEFPNITAIDLSGNRIVTTKALSELLRTHSSTLRSLVLLNTPGLAHNDDPEDKRRGIDLLAESGAFDSVGEVIESGWMRLCLHERVISSWDYSYYRGDQPPKPVEQDIRKALSREALADIPKWDNNDEIW